MVTKRLAGSAQPKMKFLAYKKRVWETAESSFHFNSTGSGKGLRGSISSRMAV